VGVMNSHAVRYQGTKVDLLLARNLDLSYPDRFNDGKVSPFERPDFVSYTGCMCWVGPSAIGTKPLDALTPRPSHGRGPRYDPLCVHHV
jgi:hypothetical protein